MLKPVLLVRVFFGLTWVVQWLPCEIRYLVQGILLRHYTEIHSWVEVSDHRQTKQVKPDGLRSF